MSCRNLGTFSKNLQPLEMYLECLPNDYIQRVFIEISILSHPSKGKNIFPVRIFWFDLSNTDLPQKKYMMAIHFTSTCTCTAHKMKFSSMEIFSKCDQTDVTLRIWSKLLKKSKIENFYFVLGYIGEITSEQQEVIVYLPTLFVISLNQTNSEFFP